MANTCLDKQCSKTKHVEIRGLSGSDTVELKNVAALVQQKQLLNRVFIRPFTLLNGNKR